MAHPLTPAASPYRMTVGAAPGWLAVSVVAAIAGALTATALPGALARVVDTTLAGDPDHKALGWLLALVLSDAAAALLGTVAAATAGAAATVAVRRRLIDHLLTLGLAGPRAHPAGDIATRVTSGVPPVTGALATAVTAFVSLGTAAVAVVLLARLDWRLTATLLLTVPAVLVLMRLFMHRAGDLFAAYQRLQSGIAARLLDALAGARSIRAGGTIERDIERVLTPLPQLSDTGHALWRLQRGAAYGVGLLLPIGQLAVLTVAGFGVTAGRLTPGELLAAGGYTMLALQSFSQVDTVIGLAHARAAANRLRELLSLPDPLGQPGTLLPRPTEAGLTFEQVTVDGSTGPVLDKLDLTVPAGMSVAVVGRSGAGKSTLAQLAGRLAEPDAGRVLLAGVDLRQLDPAALRRSVAYAFERPALLGGTVGGLLRLGRPEATTAEIEAAARAAQAHRFIVRLPAGYDTALSAVRLSGGEYQRLGLARALLHACPLTVLDDATSSLDTATEVEVGRALTRLLFGRTSLVVAHRASTAARADLVAWLHAGQVRALAPHAELWTDPQYRALFQAGSPTEDA